jgi:hypothetical protein
MDGCFDMMHFGHCNALRQVRFTCTALGSVLLLMPPSSAFPGRGDEVGAVPVQYGPEDCGGPLQAVQRPRLIDLLLLGCGHGLLWCSPAACART